MGTAQVNLGAGTTDIVESVVFNGFTGFDLLNVGAGETFDITGTDNSDATGVSISQNQGYLLGGGEQEQSFTYVASGTEECVSMRLLIHLQSQRQQFQSQAL